LEIKGKLITKEKRRYIELKVIVILPSVTFALILIVIICIYIFALVFANIQDEVKLSLDLAAEKNTSFWCFSILYTELRPSFS